VLEDLKMNNIKTGKVADIKNWFLRPNQQSFATGHSNFY
jgi:hypothetical protein